MDNQTEKYYLKKARINISNKVEKHNLPIELLTAIDSFLLAYDYAVNKIEQL